MLIDIWKHRENRWPAALRVFALALAVAYPVLAHGASILGSAALTLASVVVLAAAVLFRPLIEGRRWAWAALPLAALAILGLWRLDAAALVLFLPPVLLNAFLAWLFGHTLARGRVALIERIVLLLQPPGVPPEPGVRDYARTLTRLWTALFLALAATNLALALLATPGGLLEAAGLRSPAPVRLESWSLFANVINYLLVAGLFLVEFAYRRRRFPGRPYRNLPDFLRRTIAIAPALAASFARGAAEPKEEWTETEFTVPPDHPAFAGHFPGKPVLPAVVLLEMVADAANAAAGRPLPVVGLPWAKFMMPLAPGDRGRIRIRRIGDRLEFEVFRGEQRAARGAFRLRDGG